jgi:hypothetical protein
MKLTVCSLCLRVRRGAMPGSMPDVRFVTCARTSFANLPT